MSEKTTTCISSDAKDLLLEAFPANTELATFLKDDMATCAVEGKPKKAKRAPSEYNIFIGSCLKEQGFGDAGANMKKCAALWKAQQKGVAA